MLLPTSIYVFACLAFSFLFAQPFRTPKVAFLILCLVALGCRRPTMKWTTWSCLAWSLWPVLMPISPLDPVSAAYQRGLYLLYVLVALLVWPLDEPKRAGISVGLGWAGLLVGLYALLQVAGLDWIAWETPGQGNSFFGNANFSAHFLLLAWHLATYRKRSLAILGYCTMGLAILFSGSRAVWVVWILSIAVAYVLKFGWRWWHVAGLVIALVGLGFSFRGDVSRFYQNLVQPEAYVAEFEKQPHLIAQRDPWFKGKRLSLMTRLALYRNSLHLVKAHPLAGIGAGQFRAYYPRVALAGVPDFQLSEAYRANSPHQLVLEAAILYGIPWTCIGIVLLVIVLANRRDPRYLLAVTSQILLAMVSLNYQNPLIVVTLILLLPKPGHPPKRPSRARHWLAVVWIIPGFLVVGLDGWRGYASRQADWDRIPELFPAYRAQRAFDSGALEAAWLAQKGALAHDPFGPETIFNTGLVAWALGEAGDVDGYDLAVRAFQLSQCLHPYYRPAQDRLLEIRNSGYWEPRWNPGVRCERAWEERREWAAAVAHWQPGISPPDEGRN